MWSVVSLDLWLAHGPGLAYDAIRQRTQVCRGPASCIARTSMAQESALPVQQQVSAGGVVYRRVPMASSLRLPESGPAASASSQDTSQIRSLAAAEHDPQGHAPSEQGRIEVALIRVGRYHRWQLPKGTVEASETNEQAALREVREETGLHAELVAPLETIEYWYRAKEPSGWVRFHKQVTFYLMRFINGNVSDHDHEVHEARWVEIHQAIRQLSFENERRLVVRACTLLEC